MARTVWRVLGRSVTGASHLRVGQVCQDACAVRYGDDGSLVVAVADGAGSAAHAAASSSAAVETAAAWLRGRIEAQPPQSDGECQALLRECLEVVRARLTALCEELTAPASTAGGPASPHDVATTLILGFVTERHFATLHVGDGAVVVCESDGLQTWSPPDHGEHFNETTFVLSEDAPVRCDVQVGPSESLRALAFLSDGLEQLGIAYATHAPHDGFFLPLFAFASSEQASEDEIEILLASRSVCARSDDDKTLLLAVRMDG
jgi:hypothetical protein